MKGAKQDVKQDVKAGLQNQALHWQVTGMQLAGLIKLNVMLSWVDYIGCGPNVGAVQQRMTINRM